MVVEVLLLVVVAVVDVEIANTPLYVTEYKIKSPKLLLKLSSIERWYPAVFLEK